MKESDKTLDEKKEVVEELPQTEDTILAFSIGEGKRSLSKEEEEAIRTEVRILLKPCFLIKFLSIKSFRPIFHENKGNLLLLLLFISLS
jgi:hypothetical protein